MTDQHYYYGTGRRKSAVARVRLYPTPGGITVNGRPANEALPAEKMIFEATAPLRAVEMMDNVTVVAKITGGGTSDARFIKDYAPVAEFGLVGATIHQIDEFAEVSDITLLTDIYESMIATYFERFAK